jgi:hypothetical protein
MWLYDKPKRAPSTTDDKENAGWRACRAGGFYISATNPPKCWRAPPAPPNIGRIAHPRNKAFAIQLRGLGHELNKDYPAAIAAYREVVEISRSISPESNDVAND